MSHDRGCFLCGEDPAYYKDCTREDCPKKEEPSRLAVELLPCPFCDGEAIINRYGDRRQSTIYECTFCGCRLETGETFNFGHGWNTRYNISGTKTNKIVSTENKSKVRESTLLWSDCDYVFRKMSESQQRLMKYVAGGCKKTGLNDDMLIFCSFIELRDLLNKYIDKSKKKNG
jgi:hypothetical protein